MAQQTAIGKLAAETLSYGSKLAKAFRLDGLVNLVTGIGGDRDKSTHATVERNEWLTDEDCAALFQDNDLARTIILTIVEDALRGGFKPQRAQRKDPSEKTKKPGKDRPGEGLESGGEGADDLGAEDGDEFMDARRSRRRRRLDAPPVPPSGAQEVDPEAVEEEPELEPEIDPETGEEIEPEIDPETGEPIDPEQEELDDSAEKIEAIEREMRRLQVREKIREAAIWARTFGGAKIVVGATGAGKPDSPMDDETAKGIEFLTVLDKRAMTPRSHYENVMEPKYGEPEIYNLHPVTRAARKTETIALGVHESRLIHFGGAITDPLTKEQRQGYDLSVLQPIYEALRSVGQNWQSICVMLSDSSVGILKMKGLIDAIAEGDTETLQARLEFMDLGRSVARSMTLDAEDEEFSYAERGALSGLDGLLDKNWLRLSAAARMPVSILMGQSPAGLQNNGSIDLRWWYDSVDSYRKDQLTPPIERILRMVVRSLFPDEDPEAWSVEWPSLWQMPPVEQAEYEGKLLDNDQKLITMEMIDPMEAALSRFKDGKIQAGYSAVDLKSKKAMLEIAIEDATKPPEPPGAFGLPAPGDPNAPPPPPGAPGGPPRAAPGVPGAAPAPMVVVDPNAVPA